MPIRSFLHASALATFVIAAPVLAADQDTAARAQALVQQAYAADEPGAAVIVTRGDKVVYAGGAGLADVAASRPITADTVFRLASITKQFAAAVVLQLVAEGKLSLDDPVSRFLPRYPDPGGRATVRQLLNHTSGIKSYTGIPGWMAGDKIARPYSTAELIAEFRDQPADFQPGAQFAYNNSGYVLVGAVIEAVTGMPWHQAVEERIAKPLGLTSIRYGGEEAATPAFATGYSANDSDAFAPARKVDMSVPHAAGALLGTVGDMARWARALHHGKVVPAALYAEMIAPTALPDGTSEAYGYGLSTGTVRGHRTIGHNGGIFGFSTQSIYLPEQDVFVAVLSNAESGVASSEVVAARLAAEAIGKPFPSFSEVPFDATALAPAFGVYTIEGDGGTRRFFERDGKLYTQREGAAPTQVFAAGNDRYFYGPDSLTWFELQRASDGGYAMLMRQGGEDPAQRAMRTGPIPPEAPTVSVPREVLQSYVGSYTSAVAPIVVALRDDGVLTLAFGPQPPNPLRALTDSEFAATGVDARIVFQRNAQGAVTGLVLRQGGGELPATRD